MENINKKEIISGVPETMLQTLYARAKETKTGRNFVNDPRAVEIVEKLDYDFSFADKDKTMSSGVVARTILLDKMVNEFLKNHKDATVINIACGLDTRCYRMQGEYSKWYNLDLPETMQIRKRFFPETELIRQIEASAMDKAWTESVEEKDGECLVIIEGLTMYLTEEDVKKIFKIIGESFKNPTVFVETMNPMIVSHLKEKSIEKSQAKFSWGVRNGKKMQRIIPEFKSVEDRSLAEGMQIIIPQYKFIGKIGLVRNISNKILVFKK